MADQDFRFQFRHHPLSSTSDGSQLSPVEPASFGSHQMSSTATGESPMPQLAADPEYRQELSYTPDSGSRPQQQSQHQRFEQEHNQPPLPSHSHPEAEPQDPPQHDSEESTVKKETDFLRKQLTAEVARGIDIYNQSCRAVSILQRISAENQRLLELLSSYDDRLPPMAPLAPRVTPRPDQKEMHEAIMAELIQN